jgi:hypothetical protein
VVFSRGNSILAASSRLRGRDADLLGAFDLLFLAVDVLPATVTVAVALLVAEFAERIVARQGTVEPAGPVGRRLVFPKRCPGARCGGMLLST